MSSDIADPSLCYIIPGVVAGVNEEHGDIQLPGQIFVPLGQLITDVVGEQQKVRLYHLAAVRELHVTLPIEDGSIGQIYFGIGA